MDGCFERCAGIVLLGEMRLVRRCVRARWLRGVKVRVCYGRWRSGEWGGVCVGVCVVVQVVDMRLKDICFAYM